VSSGSYPITSDKPTSRYLSCGEQFGYGRYPVSMAKFQSKLPDSGIDGSAVDNSERLRDQDGSLVLQHFDDGSRITNRCEWLMKIAWNADVGINPSVYAGVVRT
jgi:hypothetical protein